MNLVERVKGILLNPKAEWEKIKADVDRKIKVISDLKDRQKVAVLLMDKLSSSLPDWVWLTSLSFSGQNVSLSGKALSYNLVADLIVNMQNSNSFTNVQLSTTNRSKESGQDVFIFTITCTYVHHMDKVG